MHVSCIWLANPLREELVQGCVHFLLGARSVAKKTYSEVHK